MPDDTTTSAPTTEGPGQTPAAQAGIPGATGAPTPAPLVFTAEQQAEINRIAAQARAEGRTQAQKDADKKEQDRIAAEQAAQGQFKTLAEQAQAELAQVRADLAAERRSALVSRIAGAANLPVALHKLILGDDEAAITACVAELAAVVKPPAAPPTGAGTGTRPQAPPPAHPTPASGPPAPRYSFVQPGDVPW